MNRGISLFVTSSGTDIGKTFVCCRLIESLRGAVRLRCIKPVVTGFDPAAPAGTDPARLLEARGMAVDRASLAATSPWQFRAALSADMAAAREGRSVPFDELVAFSRAPPDVELNLIEGIGGVMAPVDERHTVRDWIAALDTECLLVVGSYLGSLSHALTAADVLARIGREPLAIVISQSQSEPVSTEETAASLERHCASTPIIVLERNAAAFDAAAVSLMRCALGLA
jgi:dethiobiotin synthetase